MYALLKDLVLWLVKAPTAPPDPPAGSHDSVEVFRASPSFLTYSLLSFYLFSALSYLIPAVLILVGTIEGEGPPIFIGAVLVLLFAIIQFFVYFTVRIDYDMRYYIVTDRSLRVREGAVVVKEKTITYANVQNLRVVQGPLMRLFGIWHLMVDTAGGGGAAAEAKQGPSLHSVKVAGIAHAHQVRDQILGHLRQRGLGAGLGDLDDHDERAAGPLAANPAVLDALRALKTATAGLRETVERS
jgi:membrane protein YdbS with pleckstrin-like domain